MFDVTCIATVVASRHIERHMAKANMELGVLIMICTTDQVQIYI